MKFAHVLVPWKEGLHMRPAARLVKRAMDFKAGIMVRFGDEFADLRSIIAVVLLGAACGAMLEIQATGQDEDEAIEAIAAIFDDKD
jgi:phosphotransferase system HPr (HPr) family protein